MVDENINQFDENGLKTGKWVSHYNNGGLATEEYYLNGEMHGTQKAWDEDGVLILSVEYENGVRKENE